MEIVRTRKRGVTVFTTLVIIVEYGLSQLRRTRGFLLRLSEASMLVLRVLFLLLLLFLLPFVFGFGFVVRELDLILTNFFIVEVRRITALHSLKWLCEDKCRVARDIEYRFLFDDAKIADGCGILEPNGVKWLLDSTDGLRYHTNDSPVLKAEQ